MSNRAVYLARGAALQLMDCKDFAVLIDGPVRTGKSRGVLEKCYLFGSNCPGARILFLRKTRASMNNTMLQTWEDEVLGPGHPMVGSQARRYRTEYRFPNGSTVDVLGLDNTDRLMGSEYDLVAISEGTELTVEDFEKVTSRMTGYRAGYQQIIVDCNPSSEKHWLIRRHREGKMTRFPSRLEDNPRWHDGKNWTRAGEALIQRLGQLSGVRRARLFEGKWASADGLVYDRFSEQVHVLDHFTPPADWRRVRSIDFGYTNPFVCQWWAVDGDGRMYLYRELYQSGLLISDAARLINNISSDESISATVADHDAGERAMLEAEGISTYPAMKDVEAGIQAVQSRLVVKSDGKPRLFLMRDALANDARALRDAGKPCCTLEEFDGYVFEQSKDGRPIKEQPVKVNDHGLDALRYAVCFVDEVTRSSNQTVQEPTFADVDPGMDRYAPITTMGRY